MAKPSLTTAEAAGQITRNDSSWAATLGTKTTIAYAFRDSIPADYDGDQVEIDTFSRFNKAEIAGTKVIFALYAEVCGLAFKAVDPGGYSNNATILLGNYESDTDGSAGYSYSVASANRGSASIDGDFWYNLLGDDQTGTDPKLKPGGYDYSTVIHELGHSVGLEHPGDYNADPNDQPNYQRDAEYREDSLQYSVESYFEAEETGAFHNGLYLRTLGLHDIAALQRLYGANMATRTGNDAYGFGGKGVYGLSSAKEQAVFSIWDAGGKDTLDFSKYANTQTIDLHADKFSSTGGLKWNVSIAKGVTIENAIGGSGKDTIVGNEVANLLSGGRGADTIGGNGGADRIKGGAGFDTMDGGAGKDTLDYSDLGRGIYVELKGKTYATVEDAATEQAIDKVRNFENIVGSRGGDVLIADGTSNTILAGEGDDALNGLGGVDRLSGGVGDDQFAFGGAALSKLAVDFITDFAKGDRILLLAETFTAFTESDDPRAIARGDFSAGNQVAAMGKGDHLFFDTDDGFVYYDGDGAGSGKGALKFAEIGSGYTLGAGDFLVV